MRIISGKFRGKQLLAPSSTLVRPTGDKVKQAIFTKLQFFVPSKRVLDLFSGSGALGIEAISRDASEVVFVDKSAESVKLTQRNLKLIGATNKVYCMDYETALKSFEEPFDLILIDPPYASGVYEHCLSLIKTYNLLSSDGIIVCERDRLKPISTPYFNLADTKNYGTVSVDYFEHTKQ